MDFLHSKKLKVVHVGGFHNSAFQSISACIVDNFFTHPHLNQDVIQKIISHYLAHYPVHRCEPMGLSTPCQMMKTLIARVSMPELVETMGCTLRYLSVKEMAENPTKYPSAFAQKNALVSIRSMCESDTLLDDSSIRALAYALGIPIVVRYVTPGKELSIPPVIYHSDVEHPVTNPKVEIERESGHYRPLLNNPGYFNAFDYSAKSHLNPRVFENMTGNDLPEIIELLTLEEKRIATSFETHRIRLSTMVKAGELTKDHLLTVFCKGVGMSQSPLTQEDWVHLAWDDYFFSTALSERLGYGQPAHVASRSHDEDLIIELVYALSRALSVNLMQEDFVYSNIDTQKDTPRSHLVRKPGNNHS